MADPLPYTDSNGGTGVGPGRGSTAGTPPSTPRWVKVSGIIVLVLVLLVVIMMMLSGGGHGPGRHMRASSVTEHRVHQL